MSFVSSIKPETESVKESTYDFNDRTWQSYIKEGFEENVPHSVQAPHERLIKFAAAAGDRPITRTVTRVYRMKPASNGYKECLVAYETLTGSTWAGDEVRLVDHCIGYHKQQLKRSVLNEKKEIVEYQRSGEKEIYNIEYSISNLNKILEGQEKEAVKFIITNPNGPQSAEFMYDEFNLPWIDCIDLLLRAGGPMSYHVEKMKLRKVAT